MATENHDERAALLTMVSAVEQLLDERDAKVVRVVIELPLPITVVITLLKAIEQFVPGARLASDHPEGHLVILIDVDHLPPPQEDEPL